MLLFNQITALEEVSIELQKVNSLLTLLFDYFKHTGPEKWMMENRYQTYSDLVHVVHDIVNVQKGCIDGANGKLNTIRNELKRLGELI